MSVGSINVVVDPPPGLTFDPVDAIISFQSCSYLNAKLAAFVRHLEGDASVRLNRNAILDRFPSEVAARVPFYAELLPKKFEDIPLISKRELLCDSHSHIAQDTQRAWYKDTSGTTGAPIRIFYSADFFFEQRFLDLAKILLLRGAKPETAGVSCVHLTDTISTPPAIFASPVIPGCVLANLNIRDPRWMVQLAHLEPRFISGRPEIFAQLGGRLSEVFKRPEAVISAGSMLTAERRTAIEDTLGTRCIDVYALSEFGLVASECTRCVLHIDTTSVLVEVIGNDGRLAPQGHPGELVLSALNNAVQPLLRYRTGDQGILSCEPCACGKPGPTLRLVEGRLVPNFKFASGAIITPTCFNSLASRWALEEYQIAQSGPSCVVVLLQAGRNTPPDVVDRVAEYVRSFLPADISVEVRLVCFSSTAKRQRYVIGPPSVECN